MDFADLGHTATNPDRVELSPPRPRTGYRFRGVTFPTNSHPLVRQLRRQGIRPALHGNKLWKSSRLLIDYLHNNRPEHCAKVLDVGCGWGICGIWAAKTLGSNVTSMDADPDVFPFLEAAAGLNGVSCAPLLSSFEKLGTRQLAQFDMLIGADICFWEDLVDPVFNLVNRAVKAGVKHIIIADPARPTFLEMARRCEQRHCAETVAWKIDKPVKARGALMILENA